MRTDLPNRSTTRALAFAVSGLLSIPACAPDDPIVGESDEEWQYDSPTSTSPNSGTSLAVEEDPIATIEPSSSSTSTTISSPPTTINEPPAALTNDVEWGETSDAVRDLQLELGIDADGIYGPQTYEAHLAALEVLGLPTDSVPTRPTVPRSRPAISVDDVPASVLDAIRNAFPEEEWNRALTVARCESNYRLDAANPTSSARGVFQLLAPWTRDPGSGRTVWGWNYTDDGEKLSAAAGLGISEDDARYGFGNITVAAEIFRRSGWSPWNASRHCWG